MCSYDQTLATTIPLWLEDFGVPKVLGQMVASYVPECPRRSEILGESGDAFTSECKCTPAGRDRRFTLTDRGRHVRMEVTLDSQLRPVAYQRGHEPMTFERHPDSKKTVYFAPFGKVAVFSKALPVIRVPLLSWADGYPYTDQVSFVGTREEFDPIEDMIRKGTEDLGIDELINRILEGRE